MPDQSQRARDSLGSNNKTRVSEYEEVTLPSTIRQCAESIGCRHSKLTSITVAIASRYSCGRFFFVAKTTQSVSFEIVRPVLQADQTHTHTHTHTHTKTHTHTSRTIVSWREPRSIIRTHSVERGWFQKQHLDSLAVLHRCACAPGFVFLLTDSLCIPA